MKLDRVKNFLFLFSIAILALSCNNKSQQYAKLQAEIDSLQQKLDDTYKPGFGEFMSAIQVHHAKLWFAGTNENWPLAKFEINEIMELLDDLQKYETDRPEIKQIPMINPALDSVNKAISSRNKDSFVNSFELLTNTCNNCHHAVNYEFNHVKIPDTPPFSNQVFKQTE